MAGARRLTTDGVCPQNRRPSHLSARLAVWADRTPLLDDVVPPVVVACSGGADSVALLALTAARGLTATAVHVDHGARPTGVAEAAFVARVAARLGVAADSATVTVAPGPSFEARARDARYAALEQARHEHGAATVLVAHTADDQAETVLLNLLRGSAATGLGGMPARRGAVVRPLLALRRADTEAICDAIGVIPVRDPMNADPTYRRVWVRDAVLPELSAGVGRDLVPVLARQAELLRSESDYLDDLARAAWPPAPGVRPASALARLPLVLARRAVRIWLGPPPPSLAEVERVLAVARGDTRATEIAGGRRVVRRAGSLEVVRGSVRP